MQSQSFISPQTCTVKAGINIALIKYWGKRDSVRNLPAVGSLSLTLDPWGTTTTVSWGDDRAEEQKKHRFILNQCEIEDPKVFQLLDSINQLRGNQDYAYVESENTVPTAAGLASSASGMAALGSAAWCAAGMDWTPRHFDPHLIDIIRIGSGSAPRSLLGGCVRLDQDGQTLTQVCGETEWDLSLVVAVVARGAKAVSSRQGMERTRTTSPFYQAWVSSHAYDLDRAHKAVELRDLESLGMLMEHSTHKMHACMWASQPPLRYMKPISFSVLDQVKTLRKEGYQAWSTLDAGPHVKILCPSAQAQSIQNRIQQVAGVHKTLILKIGAGIQFQETSCSS